MKKIKNLLLLLIVGSLTSCSSGTAKFTKLSLGGENVPVGQYASKILAYYGLNETVLASKGLITYGADVKEVTTQVSQALVSCGIIYATDAKSANLTVADSATKEMCGQVIYPAAVLKGSAKQDAAKSFLSYLQGDEAMGIFESVGFSRVSEKPSEVAQVEETTKLHIFAAASMTETMNEIKTKYETAHSNITLTMNFGSSGKLQTQIEEGADCDIFISAGQKQMNAIDAEGGTQTEKDFIEHSTRVDLLENKVVLAVPDGNPVKVTSFEVLKDKLIEASK